MCVIYVSITYLQRAVFLPKKKAIPTSSCTRATSPSHLGARTCTSASNCSQLLGSSLPPAPGPGEFYLGLQEGQRHPRVPTDPPRASGSSALASWRQGGQPGQGRSAGRAGAGGSHLCRSLHSTPVCEASVAPRRRRRRRDERACSR